MFTKGVTAVLLETLVVAERAGLADLVVPTIGESLDPISFSDMVEILVGSSVRHAQRRAEEMVFVDEFVARYAVDPPMTRSSGDVLRRLAASLAEGGDPSATGVRDVVRVVAESGTFDR